VIRCWAFRNAVPLLTSAPFWFEKLNESWML
jgi:hypothetical protein